MTVKIKLTLLSQTAINVILLGTILTSLFACTPNNTSVTVSATDSPTQTNTPTQIKPSETSVVLSTKTPHPTETTTITTNINEKMIIASEFKVARACLIDYIISNDQNWIAADCPLSREVMIVNRSSNKQIIINYKDLEIADPGFSSTLPLKWSSDNRYLYFTTQIYETGDYAGNGSLYRLDTHTETWNKIVGAVYQPFYFFSPDGNKYIYFNHYLAKGWSIKFAEYLEIGMVDTITNRNKRVVLKYYWGPTEEAKSKGYKLKSEWSDTGNKFAIILLKVTPHYDVLDVVPVLLTINFHFTEMELFENFDENNLLGN